MTQPRLLGGRYELEGIVGRGGMAEVFRARDIRLDRIVAVKTLRDDLARDQTFQARFRREAQSAASLNHPSIVAVYDTGEDMVGGTPVPYIVMEYVDGRTLRDLLRDDRRLLPERAAEITDGVLRALDYSHRNGIVHRDIKPGNVMLTRDGQIKVMDFGIARAVSDAQATMTQTAQVIGTAQYLSPEQARGERVDARSDLYSSGCLLYELLVGRPPFTGDSPVAIAYQHVREEPIPPSRIDPEVPAWADAIVLKAMQKDPNDRYQTAGEMRNDIQRALSGAPVAAPQYTQTYAAGTRRMTQSTQVAGATSAIPPYRYGEEDPGQDYGEPPRRRVWPWILVALIVAALVAGGIYAFNFISGSSNNIAVPSVTGQKLPQAEQAITSAKLKVGKITHKSSSVYSRGEVISTNPGAGSPERSGTKINLVVSTGQGKAKVPRVVGDSKGAAINALSQAGLVAVVNSVPSTAPPGQVVRQSPRAGTKLKANSQVQIWVAERGATVPQVIGLSEAAAKSELARAGFQVSVQMGNAPTPGFNPGEVYREVPAYGKVEQSGSTVTIYVQAGQTSSPTPTSTSPSPSPTSTTPTPTPTPDPSGTTTTPTTDSPGHRRR
jgi:eukaryotic-like serine/threonine-protein kinase